MFEEQYISKSKLQGKPKNPFIFKLGEDVVDTKHIKDDAITTQKIKDKAVTPEKLSDSVQGYLVIPVTSEIDKKYANITSELYSMIESLQVGGIALSNQFGDRTDIGIHQKSLTKAIGKIWDEIGKLTGKDYMNFSLTVQPAFIPAEEAGTVRVTADCSEAISNFDDIKIYLNGELKAASEEIEVFNTNLSITEAGISTIKAVGTILGKVITKEAIVEKAEGFFMGSGQVYTDVIVPECAKTIEGSLEGDYDITVKNNGEYIFIIIPASRKEEFRRAKLDMNGFEIPLEETETPEYIICKTLNTYKAGTYNIDIDINS